MVNETIKTDVDRLLEILKAKGQMSLSEAGKELHIPLKTIQAWVDFLVEEKILGIEYKFTSPHIYLNTGVNTLTKRKKQHFELSFNYFKENFVMRARDKKIPESKIRQLWESHVLNKIELVKEFFYQEAKKRGISNIDLLWEDYKEEVLNK